MAIFGPDNLAAVGRVLTTSPLFEVIALTLGLVFGGLVTVAADRLGRRARAEDAGQPSPADTGLWYPPSHCDSCARPLPARAMIPVLGWLIAAGRCPHCGYRVPWLWPAFEALTALAWLGIAWHFGPGGTSLALAVLVWYLLALAAADLRHHTLPDSLTLPLLWLGLLAAAAGLRPEMEARAAVLGAAAGYGFFWLVRELYYWLRGRVGLGGGDLKLLAALGAWTGWQVLPSVILIAAPLALVLFAIAAFADRLAGRLAWRRGAAPARADGLRPFGPALAVAGGWLALFPAHAEHIARALEFVIQPLI